MPAADLACNAAASNRLVMRDEDAVLGALASPLAARTVKLERLNVECDGLVSVRARRAENNGDDPSQKSAPSHLVILSNSEKAVPGTSGCHPPSIARRIQPSIIFGVTAIELVASADFGCISTS